MFSVYRKKLTVIHFCQPLWCTLNLPHSLTLLISPHSITCFVNSHINHCFLLRIILNIIIKYYYSMIRFNEFKSELILISILQEQSGDEGVLGERVFLNWGAIPCYGFVAAVYSWPVWLVAVDDAVRDRDFSVLQWKDTCQHCHILFLFFINIFMNYIQYKIPQDALHWLVGRLAGTPRNLPY